MQIGDEVKMLPSTMVDETGRVLRKKVKGTVVFVHPQRRYYTVEFPFGSGRSYRECFWPDLAPNVGAMRDEPKAGFHKDATYTI